MRLASFFIFFLCVFSLRAQTSGDSLATTLPRANVEGDSRIDVLLDKHIECNRRVPEKGYRVQIYFGGDKTKAKEAKSRFLSRYSKTTAYEVYEVPNFKIRVGDFRTRLDAWKFLKQVQSDFSGAFIVTSDIEMPDIDPAK